MFRTPAMIPSYCSLGKRPRSEGSYCVKFIWVRRKSLARKDSVRSFTRVFSYLRPGEHLSDSSPAVPWILNWRSENVVLYIRANRKRDDDTELRIRLRVVVGYGRIVNIIATQIPPIVTSRR